jgi:hypothetical protein
MDLVTGKVMVERWSGMEHSDRLINYMGSFWIVDAFAIIILIRCKVLV